jgi:hypothetical protein
MGIDRFGGARSGGPDLHGWRTARFGGSRADSLSLTGADWRRVISVSY